MGIVSGVLGTISSIATGNALRHGARDAGLAGQYGTEQAREYIEESGAKGISAISEGRDTANTALQPLADVGTKGIQDYYNYLSNYQTDVPEFQGITEEDLYKDPSYIFRRDQGIEAVRRNMNATGFNMSGNMGTALVDYASKLASTEYANVYERNFRNYLTRYELMNNRERNYMTGMSDISRTGAGAAAGISDNNMRAGLGIADMHRWIGGGNVEQANLSAEYNVGSIIGQARARAGMYQGIAGGVNEIASVFS